MEVNMVLFNLETCPECRTVREKLAEMKLAYVCINVDPIREKRDEVFVASGQYGVPVLIDCNRVFITVDTILEHLSATYRRGED